MNISVILQKKLRFFKITLEIFLTRITLLRIKLTVLLFEIPSRSSELYCDFVKFQYNKLLYFSLIQHFGIALSQIYVL